MAAFRRCLQCKVSRSTATDFSLKRWYCDACVGGGLASTAPFAAVESEAKGAAATTPKSTPTNGGWSGLTSSSSADLGTPLSAPPRSAPQPSSPYARPSSEPLAAGLGGGGGSDYGGFGA
eukprot:EG_transcript_52754